MNEEMKTAPKRGDAVLILHNNETRYAQTEQAEPQHWVVAWYSNQTCSKMKIYSSGSLQPKQETKAAQEQKYFAQLVATTTSPTLNSGLGFLAVGTDIETEEVQRVAHKIVPISWALAIVAPQILLGTVDTVVKTAVLKKLGWANE